MIAAFVIACAAVILPPPTDAAYQVASRPIVALARLTVYVVAFVDGHEHLLPLRARPEPPQLLRLIAGETVAPPRRRGIA